MTTTMTAIAEEDEEWEDRLLEEDCEGDYDDDEEYDEYEEEEDLVWKGSFAQQRRRVLQNNSSSATPVLLWWTLARRLLFLLLLLVVLLSTYFASTPGMARLTMAANDTKSSSSSAIHKEDAAAIRFQEEEEEALRLLDPSSKATSDSAVVVTDAAEVQRVWAQQHEWCLQHRAVHGFAMHDAANCWAPGRTMTVTVLEASHLYRQQYQVTLQPLQLLQNQHVRVLGDSIARFFFTALHLVLSREQLSGDVEPISQHREFHWSAAEFHGSMYRYLPPPANITLTWQWAPTPKDVIRELDDYVPLLVNATAVADATSTDASVNETNETTASASPVVVTHLPEPDHYIVAIGNHQRAMMDKSWVRKSYERLAEHLQTHAYPDLVVQTPPRHPTYYASTRRGREHNSSNPDFAAEVAFNHWWAEQLSGGLYNATTVPVLDAFYGMHVTDQTDGIHSITHALYSVFQHLWRWQWNDETKTTAAMKVRRLPTQRRRRGRRVA